MTRVLQLQILILLTTTTTRVTATPEQLLVPLAPTHNASTASLIYSTTAVLLTVLP